MVSKKLIRQKFRDAVFERDKHCCVMCATDPHTQTLDAHHITDRNEMPNGGYVLSNGISLCPDCHNDAELYHISNGKEWKPGFHPLELYKLIGSSFTKAYDDSAGLNRKRCL